MIILDIMSGVFYVLRMNSEELEKEREHNRDLRRELARLKEALGSAWDRMRTDP